MVYGMPRAMVEAGLSDEEVPLHPWHRRSPNGYERQSSHRGRFGADTAQLAADPETAGCEVSEAERRPRCAGALFPRTSRTWCCSTW